MQGDQQAGKCRGEDQSVRDRYSRVSTSLRCCSVRRCRVDGCFGTGPHLWIAGLLPDALNANVSRKQCRGRRLIFHSLYLNDNDDKEGKQFNTTIPGTRM